MKRTSILSLLVVLGGVASLIATTAQSQVGPPKAFVGLQPTTPGTSQPGHANISGTIRAAQLVGGGSGVSGVNADLLDGLNSTSFLQSIPIPLTLIGTSNSWMIKAENATTAAGASAIFSESTGGTGNTYGGFFRNSSTSGTGVSGISNALSGTTYGVRGQTSSTGGYAVYGAAIATSGTAYGGYFQTSSAAGYGVYGFAAATSNGGFDSYGVYGENAGDSGRGVVGHATSASGFTRGVSGASDSTQGIGVRGVATASSGSTYGGIFNSSSVDGTGIQCVATAPTGFTLGGDFRAFSPDGIGVLGLADYGVNGRSDDLSGRGVFGEATATTGTTYGVYSLSASSSGRGVYGFASAPTGNTYGVRGSAVSANGYGVYAVGDSGASGVKSFRIDCPFDPENKYLLHYSAESPMPQNFYLGNVVTDSKGYAWVDLPEYFNEINVNFKYQLTVIDSSDDFVMAKVTSEIVNNRFQIRTSKPGVKVSWEVKADRNDLYVRSKDLKDVVEKEGPERGRYQHPELYGQPKVRGMDYEAPRAPNPRLGRR